jgi:glycosyltransferase involved in cell wall biosynthesis
VPRDKKVLFFGTALLTDSRKGMSYLSDALEILGRNLKKTEGGWGRDDILLLIAGEKGGGLFDALPFRKIELGYLRGDAALALAYQAADLFVCPSVEDAGPMMIPEAMLCGTPVVAFDTGGAPDLIRPHENGYLAKRRDSNDLADGIRRLLNQEAAGDMRRAAREAAFRLHGTRGVAGRYVDLCRELSEGVRR